LDKIASVSSIGSFSGISCWVGVASSPLEVDKVSNSGIQPLGNKVVFGGWVGLHDVSSLSSDVQVEYSSNAANSCRSRCNLEDIRSVLEGSSELGGISCQGVVVSVNSNDWVVLDNRVSTVKVVINETRVRSSHGWECRFNCGDVVSDSQYALAISDAWQITASWQGPVVVVGESWLSNSVSKMVLSGVWYNSAVWGSDVVRWGSNPGSSGTCAIGGVIWGSDGDERGIGYCSSLWLAVSSSNNVFRVGLVERAIVGVGGQDGNIDPLAWSPIWIIISLFGAFISVSVTIVVLSGINGGNDVGSKSSNSCSVSDVETLVPVSGLAVLVRLVRLVHSEQISIISSQSGWTCWVIVDGVGCLTISNDNVGRIGGSGAHVLEDHVAIKLGVSTTSVLLSPLDGELRSFVESHRRSVAESSFCVVLGVEESVCVISVGVGFIQTIVRSSWILHITICSSIGNQQH